MRIVSSVFPLKPGVPVLILLCSTMFLVGAVHAQTYADTISIPFSNGGHLSYSLTETVVGQCNLRGMYGINERFRWFNVVYVDPSGRQFPQSYDRTVSHTVFPDGGPSSGCLTQEPGARTWYLDVSGNTLGSELKAVQLDFVPYVDSGGDATSAKLRDATTGLIKPKYVIASVIYAPPGSASSVSYETDNVTGASLTTKDAFKVAVSNTISGDGQIGVHIGAWGFSYSVKTTISNSWSQEEQSESTRAWSAKNSRILNYRAASPPCPQYGLDHDCDAIVVMLNPVASFAIFADGKVGWSGIGYDLADWAVYPDIDEQPIWLGCLNGNFYNTYQALLQTESEEAALRDSGWGTCVAVFNQNFSRTWAANNVDGSGPALTPTLAQAQNANYYNFCDANVWAGTDLYNICHADPYANPNYAVTYPAGGLTTTDGRFTACHDNPNCSTVFAYFPGSGPTYVQSYSQTQSSSQMNTYIYSLGYSVESGTFFGLIGDKMTNSITWTWTNVFNPSTNSGQTQQASFTIVGPESGYPGPDQFTVLQDNLFGTFMLKAGN